MVTWDAKNNLVAQLAAEVPSAANGDVSADGLTITFKLKPNLKWSDGQPLTSKDVLFTWQSQVDPKNAPISRAGYDQISSIDTPDDNTAVLHFKALYPAWPTLSPLVRTQPACSFLLIFSKVRLALRRIPKSTARPLALVHS